MYQNLNDIHKAIFGVNQSREGEALEKISNLVFSILKKEHSKWDVSVPGEYSEQSYQVDGVLEKSGESIECKDYSKRGDKVGRPDVQSYEGALIDQPFKKGNFVSSTGYSNRVPKYEQGLIKNPRAIPIECYEIRNAIEKDLEGRIQKIIVNICAEYPNFEEWSALPIFTNAGEKKLIAELQDGSCFSRIDKICDEQGNTISTILKITEECNKYVYPELDEIYFTYKPLTKGYVEIKNIWIELKGIEVKIPILRITDVIEIETADEAALYVKNSSGSVDKIYSIETLKEQYAQMGGLISLRAKGKKDE